MIPFALNYRELVILSSHFVTGLKVVSNSRPFEQGSSVLTTQSSLLHDDKCGETLCLTLTEVDVVMSAKD